MKILRTLKISISALPLLLTCLSAVPRPSQPAVPSANPPTVAHRFERPQWGDLDRNGRDTRADALVSQCLYVVFDVKGKHVKRAECFDLYTGSVIATDSAASALQIDHVFPASLAWKRRAWRNDNGSICTTAKHCDEYKRFYNDPMNLIVTRSRNNGRKSDRGPGFWCPSNPKAFPVITAIIEQDILKYQFPILESERAGIEKWKHGECIAGSILLTSEGK